jgi:antimicrobial peptide system SdpA family protein
MKKIYLFSFIVFSTFFLFFVVVFVSYLPFSPIAFSNKTKSHLQTLLPQGWAFFTRSPKEKTINVYQIKNKSVENINYKSGDIQFLFGAKKNARMQMFEIGTILNQIPDSLWLKNKGAIKNTNILDTIIPLQIVNRCIFKSVKGLVIIEKIDPLPWAWCNSKNTIKMPSEFVYLNVK